MNTIRIGRFAPSPTGPLHIGSLVTALASWLDARANGHLWYVRIEDVDHAREEPGASELILEQLQMHGLHWDHWTGEGADARGVLFQQRREAAYQKALIALIAAGRAYPCTCSRKRLQYAVENGKTKHNADGEILYPGFCRPASILTCSLDEAAQLFNLQSETGTSWRFLNPNGDDFVLRRADGYWAYHLATVLDDSFQCITHILRGDDLLQAAPRHTALRLALGCSEPVVFHVPVVRNEQGEKLSKQTRAPSLRTDHEDIIGLQLDLAWSHLEISMPMGWLERVRGVWQKLRLQPLGLPPRMAGTARGARRMPEEAVRDVTGAGDVAPGAMGSVLGVAF